MSDRHPVRPRCPALLALLLAGLCPLAGAEANPWYLGLSQTLTYDSNLYRIDNKDQLIPLGYSATDTVSNTSLVAGIDQPIGRQRLFANVKLGVNRYKNNDYLNGNSYSATGGLDWSTIERLSGTVSVAGSEQQRRFNVDTAPGAPPETRKNLERVNQVDAVFRAGVVTRMTLEGSVGFRRLDYSAPEYASSEYEQTRGSLGIRYRPGIATFGAALGLADTDYNVTAEGVRRTSLDLTGSWPANGVSSLFVRLSPTRVEYDQFSQRDFTGLTGSVRWNWLPTGKLNIDTRLVHDIGQDSNFETFGGPVVVGTSNTGRTTTELRLTAAYELSAKVAMNATLGSAYRSLEQTTDVGGQSFVTGTGSDTTNIVSLGARWTPLRSVLLGCDLARDQRSASGGLTQDYGANTFSCYGQFTLQ